MATPMPAAIKVEVDLDPKQLGLEWATQTDQGITDRLNEVGASGETASRTLIPVQEIVGAVDIVEFKRLTAGELAMFHTVLLMQDQDGGIDVSLPAVRTFMAAVFGPGSTSRAALIELATISISRAVALWGSAVPLNRVHQARAF